MSSFGEESLLGGVYLAGGGGDEEFGVQLQKWKKNNHLGLRVF